MATSQLVTDTKKFVEMIVDVITDLRRKHKRAVSWQKKPIRGNCCVNNALRHFKRIHPQCVLIAYLNINSVSNKFYSIPPLIVHNIDIFALAETKLDFSFPESQFLLERMKKPYRFDVSSRKGALLMYINKNVSSK